MDGVSPANGTGFDRGIYEYRKSILVLTFFLRLTS